MTSEDKIAVAQFLIEKLYETPDGGAGGYGHIVFDDDNLDFIDSCLEDALNRNFQGVLGEETRIASIAALSFCKTLTENEMKVVLNLTEEDFK